MSLEAIHAPGGPLDAEELDRFKELGYILLPGFLPDDLLGRLRPEVDWWVDSGMRVRSIEACLDPATHGLPPMVEIEMAAHGELVSHPPLLVVLGQLMGGDFVFHHMHSNRHGADVAGKPWHHDYELGPRTDRSHLMIHALHYLDGLAKDTASLVLLPGSQRETAAKDARAHLATKELPGEVVVDRLPRGSVVLVHSALFHARRPRPGESGPPRYFTDASYCQVGTLWPPVKPYWRHVLSRARDLGLGHDPWPELFADCHFTEYVLPARLAER